MNLIFIRHGEAKQEEPFGLTKKGFAQAKAVAKRLESVNVTKTYTSDLRRAVETQREYFKIKNIPNNKTEKLREIYRNIIGGPVREGTPIDRAEKDKKRAEEIFEEIVKNGEDKDNIVVFCHGNIIRFFLAKALNLKPANLWENIVINNASISVLEVSNKGYRIKVLNNIEHLEDEKNKVYNEKAKSLMFVE